MNKNNQTAIIYARISYKEDNQFNDLKKQEEICKNYAKTNNISVLMVFKEENSLIKIPDREPLKEMLTFVLKNRYKINYLLVSRIERLGKNKDYIYIKTILNRCGVTIKPIKNY